MLCGYTLPCLLTLNACCQVTLPVYWHGMHVNCPVYTALCTDNECLLIVWLHCPVDWHWMPVNFLVTLPVDWHWMPVNCLVTLPCLLTRYACCLVTLPCLLTLNVCCLVTLPCLLTLNACYLCGYTATNACWHWMHSSLIVTVIQPSARRVVKVKVAILGSWSLTVLTVSVDGEQHWRGRRRANY